jgi:hypothetical protein
VGHGTLRRDELTRLLRTTDVESLVDIRRFPHSRHNLDVEGDALSNLVPEAGISYRKEPRRNVLGCSYLMDKRYYPRYPAAIAAIGEWLNTLAHTVIQGQGRSPEAAL